MVAGNGSPTAIKPVYDSAGSLRIPTNYKPISDQLSLLAERWGFGRDYTEPPSYALEKDPLAWLKMRRDPVIAKCLNLRRQLVAGTDYYFEAADKESKPLVPYFEAIFDRCQNFSNLRLLLTNAIGIGMQWARIHSDWQVFSIGDTPPRKIWVPLFAPLLLDQVRQDKVMVDEMMPDGQVCRRPHHYWSTYDIPAQRWLRANLDEYVRMHYDDDAFSMNYGNGLWEALYQPWHAKTYIWGELMKGISRFVRPPIHIALDVANLHMGSGGGTGFPTPEEQAESYKEVFGKIGNGDVIVTGPDGKVAVLDLEGGAISAAIEVLGYCDKVMTELTLASSMPTGGGEQGSFARAAVEAGSTSSIIAYDRNRLEEALRRTVWAVWEWNRPLWENTTDPRGRKLSTMRPPKLKIGREESDDHLRNMEIASMLLQNGAPLIAKEFYSGAGWSQPDEDDEIIAPPGTGGMMPGPGGLSINPMTGEPTSGDPVAAATPGDGFAESQRRALRFAARRALADGQPTLMRFGDWKKQQAERIERLRYDQRERDLLAEAVERLREATAA